jgi:hypothetical protein
MGGASVVWRRPARLRVDASALGNPILSSIDWIRD